MGTILDRKAFPLLLGGDCSMLVGILALAELPGKIGISLRHYLSKILRDCRLTWEGIRSVFNFNSRFRVLFHSTCRQSAIADYSPQSTNGCDC